MTVLVVALFAAAGLWMWPSADWVLARVVDRPTKVREARWLGRSRAGPDPFDVAAAYDLFAVCLRAGLPVAAAAEVAAEHAPPVIGEPMARAADLLALGADGQTAWAVDAAGDESFAELAALARRAARAGASLADGVAELASATRRRAADEAVEAAEKAGVKVSGPLGLCFLPAFVCLGIVPVVIGLAAGMLTSV
ncbi:type II secretion system F family protein [Gordonia liuliyuniae]|uniref:Type II secretion system F family protein n=1 Tax=Gordonia liuliyuniae TaxID=2911517 RepID=A0ABS9IT04_9ACTN|nr:type II secretion system F family protein [Gordonia liuliyuniae]MCF8588682.1 type II secretion system F family protein [Gordonia liuliyuniae]